MKKQFDALKYIAYEELKNKDSEEFEKFKGKLCTTTCQPHYTDFLTKVHQEKKDVEQLYSSMRQCWHILDVGLLEILINCISPKLNNIMKKYKEKLEAIELQPIALVAKSLQELYIHPDNTEDTSFSSVIEKIDWDPNEYTIRDLNNLRRIKQQELRKLGLTKCLMTLCHVALNGVVVTWLVPSYDVEPLHKIFETFVTKGIYFGGNNIISIELNNHIFVTMEKVNY